MDRRDAENLRYRTDTNGRITITSPGTIGGGYTVSVQQGSASMSGLADGTSLDAECANL
jgi:hypothetical protein